ncbi:hypothetical protein [Nocardioides flavescens]|uniref:Uncharacterized protein n=1 Tax=Nocardioides flavescens TaxID=2691959 RepID=A0A6L7F218_9ACTN|nr:hypothetical protein [Nocardioides flavescens]MXG91479.1 hypothetical protein [Nocardioides flavescens]
MSDEQGQVSEAENLRGPAAPVADSQAIAGDPANDDDGRNEGAAGPNANTNQGDGTGEPEDGSDAATAGG